MKQRSERNVRLEHELEIGDELVSASFEAYLWFVFLLCVLSLKLEASLMLLVLLMLSSPENWLHQYTKMSFFEIESVETKMTDQFNDLLKT